MTVVPSLRLSEAVDLWMNALALEGKTPRSRQSYYDKLKHLIDAHPKADVIDITETDVDRFLARWSHRSVGTRRHSAISVRQFFAWLVRRRYLDFDPAAHLELPKALPPEDLDVTTISEGDVRKLLAGCRTDTEKLAVYCLAYMGPRRHALAQAKWRDIRFDFEGDLLVGYWKFQEKGRKPITKPIPAALVNVLLEHRGEPDEYVVPNERGTRASDRDDRVIWRAVKRVAARAGVDTHVHALRAAFAVHFLEAKPGELIGLQNLMGHRRLETTMVYLRRLNRDRRMEQVRDLDWGLSGVEEREITPKSREGAAGAQGFDGSDEGTPSERLRGTVVPAHSSPESPRFDSFPVKAPSGFEPLLPTEPVSDSRGPELEDALEELRRQAQVVNNNEEVPR